MIANDHQNEISHKRVEIRRSLEETHKCTLRCSGNVQDDPIIVINILDLSM